MSLKDHHYIFMHKRGFTDEEIAKDWAIFEKDYQAFLDEHGIRDEDLEKMETFFATPTACEGCEAVNNTGEACKHCEFGGRPRLNAKEEEVPF